MWSIDDILTSLLLLLLLLVLYPNFHATESGFHFCIVAGPNVERGWVQIGLGSFLTSFSRGCSLAHALQK